MIDAFKALSPLLITLLVVLALIFFRQEVRTLVKWIAGLRKIEKTAEGYAIHGSSPAEPPPPISGGKGVSIAAVIEREEEIDSKEASEEDWPEALSTKNYSAAINLLEDQITRSVDPEEKVRLLAFLAHVHFEQAQEKGVAAFERLIREHPTDHDPYLWYALSLRWKHRYRDALNVFDRGILHAEKCLTLFRAKAETLQELGRYDEAISAALAGVSVYPDRPELYATIAKAHRANGDLASAQEWFRKAYEAAPEETTTLTEYAEFLLDRGENHEALTHYATLVGMDPANSRYWGYLGNVYLNLEMNSHALEAYERANELAGGQQAWLIANIANLYQNRGFHAAAIARFHQALALDPSSKYAHERLAKALQLLSKEREKVEALVREGRRQFVAAGSNVRSAGVLVGGHGDHASISG